jgi:hypothetical protein
LLRPEHIALIASGISAIVASRDARLRPSLMRAVGTDINADGSRITVYLNRPAAVQLLADLEAHGHLAVVFSEPSTHRTVQVKTRTVSLRAARPEDREVLRRYLGAMEWQLSQVDIRPEQTRVMLDHRFEDVVAVSFTPEQAYDQTPGPQAGASLPGTVA